MTERAGAEVLSLPLSPAHSDDDIRDAVAALRRVHERSRRMKRAAARRRDAARHRRSRSPTSSTKIDLGKTAHILGSASVPWLVALGDPDARDRAADGVALAAAARGARRARERRRG